MKRTARLTAWLVLVTVFVASPVGAAFATASATPGEGSAAAVARVTGGAASSTPGLAAGIPANPATGISLPTPEGRVTIGVPGAERAGDRAAFGATAVYPDAARGTDVAVQPTGVGGVRLMTVLEGAHAPHRFEYPMTVPDGAAMRLTDDGGGLLFLPAANGSAPRVLATIAPAWALDANGAPVATHYEVRGTTLTQVVAHGDGTAYPVVADPQVEQHCNPLVCELTLDRATTRNARDASWIIGAVSFLCGPLSPACAPTVTAASVVLAVYAGRVYEDGDCLGIMYLRQGPGFPPGVPGPAWPVRVKHGTANCS